MNPKTVVVLGSSGGNLFQSGGADPSGLLSDIAAQCRFAGIRVEAAQFIAAGASMDKLKEETPASLWVWNRAAGTFELESAASLKEINEKAAETDAAIAALIEEGAVDGLILMSADPLGANRRAIAAAVARKLPVVGTGGTSMGTVKSLGANVVSFSGTTGTSNLTRAVTYAMALGQHWKLPDARPVNDAGRRTGWTHRLANVKVSGIMTASMPAFIAVSLLLSLSRLPYGTGWQDAVHALALAPAVILAAIAAKQVSDLGELSLIAGIIAGLLSASGGVIGAIAGGVGAGLAAPALFKICTRWKFPATTVNIVAGGAAGLIPGLAMLYGLAPAALWIGDAIRSAVEAAQGFSPLWVGALLGLLMWPAIMGGWYHVTVLPIVLLQMEKDGYSFFGALDIAGLVMVSAGILLAQVAVPATPGDREAAQRPLWMNIGFGTFVEASYPYMRKNKLVFAGALLASGIAGALAGVMDIKSTAYVPSFLAWLLSNNGLGLLGAMGAAMIAAFAVAACANLASRRWKSTRGGVPKQESEEKGIV